MEKLGSWPQDSFSLGGTWSYISRDWDCRAGRRGMAREPDPTPSATNSSTLGSMLISLCLSFFI